ncbi:Uncharacterized protein APZ42_018537 [Daphnia magna]|uniref:Uncharacterized protein n=1 Tax=Daphnia magna TaxID=35525 RepID=A0A0P4YIX9_9CRUS|nr:Uncharacterized protein APZ42_018537 [Daphnia magna]
MCRVNASMVSTSLFLALMTRAKRFPKVIKLMKLKAPIFIHKTKENDSHPSRKLYQMEALLRRVRQFNQLVW